MLLVIAVAAKAQIMAPVHWSYGAKKISKDEAVIFMKATIDDGWHIYSLNVNDGGPVKTSFKFPASSLYALVGKTSEPTPVTRFEEAFKMNVSYFEHGVIFQQKVKLKAGRATVKGTLEYMTCNDHQCLPPEDVDFSVPIN